MEKEEAEQDVGRGDRHIAAAVSQSSHAYHSAQHLKTPLERPMKGALLGSTWPPVLSPAGSSEAAKKTANPFWPVGPRLRADRGAWA